MRQDEIPAGQNFGGTIAETDEPVKKKVAGPDKQRNKGARRVLPELWDGPGLGRQSIDGF